MADLSRLNDSLDQMIRLMTEMKSALGDATPPQLATTAVPVPPPSPPYDSFEQLQEAVRGNQWPEAVNPHLICDPTVDADKTERGRGIIELMIEEDLKELKFLDFGCGEGHCAAIATEYNPTMSVGYDVVAHSRWQEFPQNDKVCLTTDFAEVQRLGPYNVILLFDVIDHLQGEDIITVLTKVKSVLANAGKIYVRVHPYASRHATHLYHELNKAYLHLVFTEDELRTIIPYSEYQVPSTKVLDPLADYAVIIETLGLRVINKRDITEKVEPFFKIPKIAERIIRNTGTHQFPEQLMSMQFIDAVLTSQ